MNAFGSKYRLGLPGKSFPEKAGFQEGRMGFRLSPSFVGLKPNCGVNGKPDCRVSMPLSVQPPASFCGRPWAPRRNFLPVPKGSSEVELMTATWRASGAGGVESKLGIRRVTQNRAGLAPPQRLTESAAPRHL